MDNSISIQSFINGGWHEGKGKDLFQKSWPHNGEKAYAFRSATAEQVGEAVKGSQEAFPAWSARMPEERSRLLFRLADLMERDAHYLASLESEDTGKPLSFALQVDIQRSIKNIRFFASISQSMGGESYQMGAGVHSTVKRQALGVVAVISPWNLPLYLLTWKLAPALAAGNCVIAKPSELSPRTAQYFAELSLEAGIPPAVLQVLQGTGKESGQAILDHRYVKAVSFTGGTQTGRQVAMSCAKQLKKYTLELGGKNPSILFADADLDKALPEIARAAFANQGQICLCGSRILIEASIFEASKKRLVEEALRYQILKEEGAQESKDQDKKALGALISQAHWEKVDAYVSIAKKEGAKVLCGGKKPREAGKGFFYEATLIEGVEQQSTLCQEEIFGPVAIIQPFENEEQALAMANDVPYGLAASIWTENSSRIHRFSDQLEAGIIWVNCWLLRDLRVPFGGMKESGQGREGGMEALNFFTEAKSITQAYGMDN